MPPQPTRDAALRSLALLYPPPADQVRKKGNSVQALINVNAKAQFEQKYWRGVLDSQGKVDGGYY
eukprot:2655877-Prymnesium_polylepis.2